MNTKKCTEHHHWFHAFITLNKPFIWGQREWSANTFATWHEQLTTWKDPDAGRDWSQKEKRTTEDKMVGWHHWCMAWTWANSRRRWVTGRPGVLQSMGSQRARHNLVTEQQLGMRQLFVNGGVLITWLEEKNYKGKIIFWRFEIQISTLLLPTCILIC